MKCFKKNKNSKFISIETQNSTENEESKENRYNSFDNMLKRSKFVENVVQDRTFYEHGVCVYCLNYHNGKKCELPLCRWCNDIGHSSSKCKRLADPDRITLCKCFKNTFHSVNDCPQSWRRYKLNREIDLSNILKSCSNCSSPKHFTNDCVKEQNKFSLFNSEYLQDMSNTLNEGFKKKKGRNR
ncbi:Protein AIR2 [Nosema granulosis]|uniref:Protein AIR2 n=1 Tax=Nosema granulosis TaxID=83296 RepID=A0A9P6GZN4_9MICR|nr:Protein AIR2 [Nosema granulosis]